MAHTPALKPRTAAPRILVVDDSAAQRAMTIAHLRRWKFDVDEAADGVQALYKLRTDHFDIVISDWMMPQMDGVDLCERFRDLPEDTYTYFVLVTSKSDKADIAEGLEAGADDFLTKPFHADELRARLTAGLRIVDMDYQIKTKGREISEAYKELKEVHAAVNRDLDEAAKLQRSLLPPRDVPFEGGRMCFFMESCGYVGGDLVGTYRINDRRIVAYSIDVSGHGISSALLTARLASQMNASDRSQHAGFKQNAYGETVPKTPAEIAGFLNDSMLGELSTEHYFTMALLDLEIETGRGCFVQAGHPQPVIFGRSDEPELLGDGGPPIGLIEGMEYSEHAVTLKKGSSIILYSDGFVEAENLQGDMFDDAGLLSSLRGRKGVQNHETLTDILWEVRSFASGKPLGDDLSAVLITRDP